MKKTLFALFTALTALCACQSGPQKKADVAGHVIVIGLDGWGTWSFEKGDTPLRCIKSFNLEI